MNKLLNNLNKFRVRFNYAFIISSVVLCILSLLAEFNFITDKSIIINNYVFILNLVFLAYYFESINTSKYYKYAMLIIFTIFDLILYIKISYHFSIFFIVLYIVIFSLLINKLNIEISFICQIVIITVVYFLIAFIHPYFDIVIKYIALNLKNTPSLFAVINNIYKLLFTNSLEDYVFSTGIGLTRIIDGNLVNGIQELFIFNTVNKDISVSKFLSYNYIINIFVSIGIFLNLYSKIDKKSRTTLCILLFSTIVGGNNLLLCLYLFLLSPLSYFAYLFLTFLSNVIVSFIDIRIGYVYFPNIIELIKYMNKPVYFFVIGIIFTLLSYYLYELIFTKIKAKNNFIVDKNARRIINSIGGLKNIQRLEDDVLIVKNPNLINIIRLDCEIYNNRVVLLENDLSVLKEYL